MAGYEELVQSMGFNPTPVNVNPYFSSGAPSSNKAPKGPTFSQQLTHTITTVPGQVAGAVARGVATDIGHMAGGISTALTAGGQNHANEQYRQAIESAGKRYHQLYTSGKMSKSQYTKLSQGLIKQSQDLSSSIGSDVSNMTSPEDFAKGLVNTAAMPFTFGSLAAAKGAGVLAKATEALGATGKTGGTVAQIAKAPIKYAAIDQPTAQFGAQTVGDIKSGNAGKIAGDVALMAAPYGISKLAQGAKALLPKIGEAMHGKSSILSDAFGAKRLNQFVKDNANNPEAMAWLKRQEMFTANQPNKQVKGEFLRKFYAEKGVDSHTAPMEQLQSHFQQYAKQTESVAGAIKSGVLPKGAVASADFRQAVPVAVKTLQKLGPEAGVAERVAAVNKAIDEIGITNDTVKNQIGGALLALDNGEMAGKLKPIVQKFILKTPKGMLDKGYIATPGPKVQAVMPSLEEAAAAGMPDVGVAAHGPLKAVGQGLKKIGMGLESTPAGVQQALISKNLDARLAGTPYEGKAQSIMRALQGATSKTRGVLDPRLLRATPGGIVPGAVNISHELGVSEADAKMILKNLKGAYANLPVSVRGAGPKLTDKAIQRVPGMATFLKAQGYGKFSMNPFFWSKLAIKGEFIAQAETGGKSFNAGKFLSRLSGTAPSTETMKLLESQGRFSQHGMAAASSDLLNSLPGELADRATGPQIAGYLQRTIGQAAEQFAKNNGTTVKDIMAVGEDGAGHALKPELDHLLQMIVGYPKGSGYLNTNFAKTLNVLVFPSRFETKVAMATAHYFMSQPKVTQLAFINGALKANAWVGSPDGRKFMKDNADAVGILNYFSPTSTVKEIMGALGSGNIGDLGQVGGLPFGVITTILKNQGVKLPGQVTGNDINPATGEDYAQKLPTTTKARAQQALTDLIGQMFSYPGATVGAKSKTSLIQDVMPGSLLKINPKEQKTIGSNKPTLTAANKTPAGAPTIKQPIFRTNPKIIHHAALPKAAKGRKPKTLAKMPGTF